LGRAFVAAAPEGLDAIFTGLAADHGGSSALRQVRLRAAAMTLCSTLAETAPPEAAAGPAGDPRIAVCEALIRSHLDQQWTLADYATALAISQRHLRRMCLQATGMSAHALVETIRLRARPAAFWPILGCGCRTWALRSTTIRPTSPAPSPG
jgi:AraC family transcriptional regulator, transcriptional activator of pobA